MGSGGGRGCSCSRVAAGGTLLWRRCRPRALALDCAVTLWLRRGSCLRPGSCRRRRCRSAIELTPAAGARLRRRLKTSTIGLLDCCCSCTGLPCPCRFVCAAPHQLALAPRGGPPAAMAAVDGVRGASGSLLGPHHEGLPRVAVALPYVGAHDAAFGAAAGVTAAARPSCYRLQRPAARVRVSAPQERRL